MFRHLDATNSCKNKIYSVVDDPMQHFVECYLERKNEVFIEIEVGCDAMIGILINDWDTKNEELQQTLDMLFSLFCYPWMIADASSCCTFNRITNFVTSSSLLQLLANTALLAWIICVARDGKAIIKEDSEENCCASFGGVIHGTFFPGLYPPNPDKNLCRSSVYLALRWQFIRRWPIIVPTSIWTV